MLAESLTMHACCRNACLAFPSSCKQHKSCALPQVRSLKASANAAADESANAKFRLQTARQAVSELREMIVEARTPQTFSCAHGCVATFVLMLSARSCGVQSDLDVVCPDSAGSCRMMWILRKSRDFLAGPCTDFHALAKALRMHNC